MKAILQNKNITDLCHPSIPILHPPIPILHPAPPPLSCRWKNCRKVPCLVIYNLKPEVELRPKSRPL